jgi:hypothetical protein
VLLTTDASDASTPPAAKRAVLDCTTVDLIVMLALPTIQKPPPLQQAARMTESFNMAACGCQTIWNKARMHSWQ